MSIQRMSLALQARYRQLEHDVFFRTIDSFEDVAFGSGAVAVLVFSALTPATDARISGRQLELAPAQVASTAVHWDLQDRGLLEAVARISRVRSTLMARLDSVAEADIVRSETLVHVAG